MVEIGDSCLGVRLTARRSVSVSVWYLNWKAVMFGYCTSLSLWTYLAFAAKLTAYGKITRFLIDRFTELYQKGELLKRLNGTFSLSLLEKY